MHRKAAETTTSQHSCRPHKLVLILVLSALVISGCISLVPTPNFARAGDVVNIGLGGIKRNASGQRIFPEDLVVTITDADNVERTATVLGTYRAFPDHASVYAVRSQDRTNSNFGDLYPHDGATWVTIRLADVGGNPLLLAEGDGYISISSSKLVQTNKVNEGFYDRFDITILPGVGDPSVADGQNQAYQTDGYLSIVPSTPPTGTVAGAQLEIVFNSTVTANDPYEMRLVPQHHDPNLGLIQSVIDNGDGTKTLTAYLTNPNGFVEVGSWQQGQSTYFDLQLALTSAGGGVSSQTPAQIAANFTVTPNSYYIDMNGDPIPGIAPLLLNEFQ